MPAKHLSLLIDAQKSEEAIERLMETVYQDLQTETNQIICLGPQNNASAEKVSSVFYHNRQHPEARLAYPQASLKSLKAVISSDLLHQHKRYALGEKDLESLATEAFLYGTATCQGYAALSAILFAQRFHASLSIYTLSSDESHTFLVLDTNPPYLFDFYSEGLCRMGNWRDYNEMVSYPYRMQDSATLRIDSLYTSQFLCDVGERLFTQENQAKREQFLGWVTRQQDAIMPAPEPATDPGFLPRKLINCL